MTRLGSLILLVGFLVGLNGCASYSDKFECNPGKGIACKSVSQINAMVDRGEIKENLTSLTTTAARPSPVHLSNFNYNEVSDPKLLGGIRVNTKTHEKVTRLPERTARIWLNSFVDEKGDYVSETYVHVVIEPGKWAEK